MEKKTLKT